MISIIRNPEAADTEHFDVIIVGGGIYGAMLLLQAAQQDLRVLLLEKGDFGSETSYNSLRIIHGGLRYLQTLDFARFNESVAERQWFLSTFPDLVKPLPCMMPLYNKGAKRNGILKTALLLNDLLSPTRNRGVKQSHYIKKGRILNVIETRKKFPGVIENGLTGSALWYDAHAPDTQRIIMEALKWACSLGGQAFNYVEVIDILQTNHKVCGVRVTDRHNGGTYEFRGDKIINATGPWSRSFSQHFDRDVPELFRPSKAWNILFNKPAPSGYALALTPDRDQAQTYFVHPWKGRLLVGTGHASCKKSAECDTSLEEELLEAFINDINLIMPHTRLTMDDVEHIYSGRLPVSENGGTTLTKRAVIYDHGIKGGPKGLYSISGIKFTTSRKEAEKTLKYVLGRTRLKTTLRPVDVETSKVASIAYEWMPSSDDNDWKMEIKKLINHEAVLHLDDLVYRRTSIGDNKFRVQALAKDIASLFDWDELHRKNEILNLIGGLAIAVK